MFTLIDPLSVVATFIGLAFVAWLVRSIAESDPDPLLLNFTFFAFAGQCVLIAESARLGFSNAFLLVLLLPATILLLLQIVVIRAQKAKTLDHYKDVLERNKRGPVTSEEIERWAVVLLLITGVDFYPEFYSRLSIDSKRGPRGRLRRQALSVLPETNFNVGESGLSANELMLPPEERRLLWRCYATISLMAWCVFIATVLLVTQRVP